MTRRALLLPVLALVHLGVFLAVMWAPRPADVTAMAPALVVVAVADAPDTPEAPPPPVVAEIVAVVDAPQVEIAADDQVAASGPCELTADVETALRHSAAIPAAVVHIPAAARSVSNALLLWDGAWMPADAIGGPAALAPIQQVVKARILAASTECQQVAITGPRLMVVPDGTGSIVLAFGSGRWRWNQLLA